MNAVATWTSCVFSQICSYQMYFFIKLCNLPTFFRNWYNMNVRGELLFLWKLSRIFWKDSVTASGETTAVKLDVGINCSRAGEKTGTSRCAFHSDCFTTWTFTLLPAFQEIQTRNHEWWLMNIVVAGRYLFSVSQFIRKAKALTLSKAKRMCIYMLWHIYSVSILFMNHHR